MATPSVDDLTVVTADGSCVVCGFHGTTKDPVRRVELEGADGTMYRDLCDGCKPLVEHAIADARQRRRRGPYGEVPV